MYSYERSLVKKMDGKPFVLLGVNTDESPGIVKDLMAKQTVTWRSWYDGKSSKICRQWDIQFFPSIFLIDQHGVIRYINPEHGDIDTLVEKLVAEAGKPQS